MVWKRRITRPTKLAQGVTSSNTGRPRNLRVKIMGKARMSEGRGVTLKKGCSTGVTGFAIGNSSLIGVAALVSLCWTVATASGKHVVWPVSVGTHTEAR
ncbi:hypothetical protein ACJRO7_012584 [Eucalyptus globulus]|uniref:Uncharacterized protein n=1 Tax=Eucalyptus globulus TaxID=34317 RepID=A0ABD3LIZ4_EUCGL